MAGRVCKGSSPLMALPLSCRGILFGRKSFAQLRARSINPQNEHRQQEFIRELSATRRITRSLASKSQELILVGIGAPFDR